MMELAWGRDDVIHLEVGEPGFATPDHIREAAADAARAGWTKYAPTPGLPELREALVTKLRDYNGLNVTESDGVLVTNGGANALFVILGSILGPGDSILLPDPGWSNFTMMAKAFGADIIYYRLDAANGYLPDPDGLRSLIDHKTRAVVFNSPSNPLGTVIPQAVAESLFALCEEKDLWLVSDECYDQLDFSGQFVSFGSLERRPHRVLSVYSFSKVYAMTGWRVGYCALPAAVVEAALGLLHPSVMCVNTPAQFAALAAITGPADYLDNWRKTYQANRDLVLERLAHSGHSARCPDGGFYVWMKIGDLGERTSEEWALERLAARAVAVTPGSSFGSAGEGFVRISLATPREQLAVGIERLLT
jgi:aspartate/methionine/tyrosine aminotransferase